MRASTKWWLTIAFVVPMVITVGGTASRAAAAGGTTCSSSSGTATFKPPLPVFHSKQKVEPAVTVKGAKSGGCKGGGVTSGTFSSTSKFHADTNCDIFVAGKSSPHPPTGTLTTKWNTGKTSTTTVTLNAMLGQPTKLRVKGKVTTGVFKGMKLSATIEFAPKPRDCVSAPLASVAFRLVGKLQIS
ncbi:MAG TPA: hypothetical protein VH914_10180 [Acidimicrobiia bacterium]|nr:hypothetical protein [Acidimicrobiia bacterium]